MQPKIYTFEEHQIPPHKIDKHAYYIIEKLRHFGHIAYLVGGSVRDLFLGLHPKDFDIATSAKPEEIKKLFPNCILIGRRFRLAHIRFGKKIIEVSTFRSGDADDASLIVRDNIWGTPEEDVLRRDFTINGLFYNPENQTIIDYVDGFSDLKNRLLRTIGKAEIRFQQDPVRMIRLLKFQARLQFTIESSAHEALINYKEEIQKSSSARILEELLRMLESGHSSDFFTLLYNYHFLASLFPFFDSFDQPEIFYPFLKEIDTHQRKHIESLNRSILLSALLFPIFEKRILSLKKELHLGAIAEKARQFINDFFLPFFRLPNAMKAELISIFTNQFRFHMYDEKRKRIPKDPLFSSSLAFFEIRCALDPKLFRIYSSWNEAFLSHKKGFKKPEPRR